MKNIIKVVIALFFILGAFFIGKYRGLEENKSAINKLKENLSNSNKQINAYENQIKLMSAENTTLRDSILKITEKQGITKNIVHLADSTKNENDRNK